MAQGLDSTKLPARPSSQHTEQSGEDSEKSSLDKSAMESAKRGQNRIHSDESEGAGGTEFTK